MKIGPVGAELIHADRWTDGQTAMTKLTVAWSILQSVLQSERDQTISKSKSDLEIKVK